MLVQSAFKYTTPLRAKASATAGEWSATRSLTRQVMHQAAVALTNTGVPRARSSASRSGVKGSHRAPRGGGAAAEEALDAAIGARTSVAPSGPACRLTTHTSQATEP